MAVSVNKPIICPVLIGRTTELTSLRALLEQVKGGQGQVVVLSGEAGIGKSRLMTETRALAIAEGFRVLQGSCFPTDRNCPYAPLLDLLRSFLTTDARTRIIAEHFDWAQDVAAIQAPTLIVVGDADTVRPAHAVEMFGLLGGGKADSALGNLSNAQLTVLPGTTEFSVLSRTDLLTAIIPPFLDAPIPIAR